MAGIFFRMTIFFQVVMILNQSPAVAADFQVRDHGGDTYVSIDGTIETGDAEKFRVMIKNEIATPGINGIIVVLDSQGGNVAEAVAIGKVVRSIFAQTRTAQTWILPLGESLPGHPALKHLNLADGAVLPDVSKCWSACTIVLYSGSKISVFDNVDMRSEKYTYRPTIGVHRPRMPDKQFSSLSPSDAQKAYEDMLQLMSDALSEMGAPESFIRRTMAMPPTNIDFISKEDFYSLYEPNETFLNDWLVARCGLKTDFLTSDERDIWNRYKAFVMEYSDEWDALGKNGESVLNFYTEDVALVEKFGLVRAHQMRSIAERVDSYSQSVAFCEEVTVRTLRQSWADLN